MSRTADFIERSVPEIAETVHVFDRSRKIVSVHLHAHRHKSVLHVHPHVHLDHHAE